MELHISITGDEASGKKVLDILTGGSVMEQLERQPGRSMPAVLKSTTMTSTWMKYQKRFLERRWTNEQRTL